ncbi:MAG TPA: tRNA (cytidine(34)-2'-O)-methyltransferase [Erysipelotrichaceae bacterium]|nr:tRNA (cytidine(34)-2'-O)-methyltransferase [Erysipelotrichaceae bacterium]
MIHIVLFEPEIPQNTGNIIRTTVATDSTLHLIKPYGFILNESHLQRAGMDYIDKARIVEHLNWDSFVSIIKQDDEVYYLSRYGHKYPASFDYTEVKGDIYLVFGKESTGIPKTILKNNLERCIRLPMVEKARSLNLANTVAIMVYEVLRQLDYPGLSKDECQKGADFLGRNNFDEVF